MKAHPRNTPPHDGCGCPGCLSMVFVACMTCAMALDYWGLRAAIGVAGLWMALAGLVVGLTWPPAEK